MSYFNIAKINNKAVDGLLGVSDSLAYKVQEIEDHLHNSELWYGNDGDSTMSRVNNLTSWVLTAGTGGAYGTAVQLSAANDTLTDSPAAVFFDLHKLVITQASATGANYVIQFWTGTGIFSGAAFRTEVPYRVVSNTARVGPMSILCPRISVTEKIWARVKCATNGATANLIIGVHAYEG